MFHYHKILAPRIWESQTHLCPLVNQTLQMISAEYINFLGNVIGLPLAKSDIHDIFVHGSITNYYWDKHSDIDLCIVADLSKFHKRLDNLNTKIIMRALTNDWKHTFFISIFGRGVDITLVDYHDTYDPNGKYLKVGSAYSLFKDSWIRTPVRIPATQLQSMQHTAYTRYRVIMRQCRYILHHKKSAEFVDAYLSGLQQHRIHSMRTAYEQPITSTTMAFKMVRNRGMLRRLRQHAKQMRSKTYRLD